MEYGRNKGVHICHNNDVCCFNGADAIKFLRNFLSSTEHYRYLVRYLVFEESLPLCNVTVTANVKGVCYVAANNCNGLLYCYIHTDHTCDRT